VFDAIERIEIALRTQVIYQYSLAYDAWWFENPSLYTNNYNYSKDLAKLDKELDRSSEVFINHYKTKYSNPQRPPAWISLEVTSIGLLSKIYRDLKMDDTKKRIAKYFGVGHPKILESWMQSISYVRNVCAHHSRLFNRVLTLKPTYPTNTAYQWLNDKNFHHAKVYGFLSCVIYILKIIQNETHFVEKFKSLLTQHPKVKPYQMGMSANWINEPLWQ
jgi:abortive infection bacteriophage resistance protein